MISIPKVQVAVRPELSMFISAGFLASQGKPHNPCRAKTIDRQDDARAT